MQDATDDDAAISMFRLGRKPTIAQFQSSGRVPRIAPLLQTDRRECIEHNEFVTAAKEHCVAAFESLLDHLSGRPQSFSSCSAQTSTHQHHFDKCPFYVRWEVPRYTLFDIEKINNDKLMEKMEKERQALEAFKIQESRNNSPQMKNDEPEEMDSDIVRWPLNPIGFECDNINKLKKIAAHIEPEFKVHAISNDDWTHQFGNESGSKKKKQQQQQQHNLEEHEQDDDVKEFLHDLLQGGGGGGGAVIKTSPNSSHTTNHKKKKSGVKINRTSAASLASNMASIANSINPSGEVFEQVEMDPLYSYVKELEEKHSGDALWSTYFPKTEEIVRHRKVNTLYPSVKKSRLLFFILFYFDTLFTIMLYEHVTHMYTYMHKHAYLALILLVLIFFFLYTYVVGASYESHGGSICSH
jgi:hypothetical protein